MSRWLEETGGTSGEAYDERFRALARRGVDVHGEAAYVDALLRPGPERARVLDAGCGTGRVAVELARRGHDVVGVDNDPSMLAVARRSEGPRWAEVDLAALDPGHLARRGLPEAYDLVVAAGNVVVFLAPGTEPRVVERLAAVLRPGGLLVSGWRTDRLPPEEYDRWVRTAGLEHVVRHATWDGDPWHEGAVWCVAVDRRPAGGAAGSAAG